MGDLMGVHYNRKYCQFIHEKEITNTVNHLQWTSMGEDTSKGLKGI